MSTVIPIDRETRLAQRRANLPDALTSDQMRKRAVNRMRFALTNFVEDNQERVQTWLDTIAVVDGPAAALDRYLKLLEFAVPKLSRAEVAVEDAGSSRTAELSMDELQRIIREGVALERRTIDGEVDTFDDLV